MVILYILLVLTAVIIARTLMFTPPREAPKEYDEIQLDGAESIRNLFELIRCRTVSRTDPRQEDEVEFEKLISLLPKLYPNVWNKIGRGLPLTPLQRTELCGAGARWIPR